ncbi:hypothetical protein AMIS_3480 [Actinoplanes missouriensis 431]|uniref:Uncharacterized protein n=1 Tax=Actinoplanes missouriensis (strain ATCC 14538 / DSM 43046 / CBS 188.64 / JCM 3121 / NBRC 102363 / NCIMB 12654 / NRRL B-3342 / UNCC 431) TaxID=512565 RepID=I0GXT1_ACTM4|nr:DUF6226 family protein [Actinoplanes missouriensis]BAL85568.1 hypothetical protein AMIS_3480 [Actinoplanes missouriensis 431]
MDGDRHATPTDRFVALHDAADALLDDLTERYLVERRETKEPFGLDDALVRTVRLIPRSPSAAPLAIHFTNPGLVVRLGRWWEESLPPCACATCDDDPRALEERLRVHIAALIEGGLWERVRRGVGGSWFETRLIGAGVTADREGPLSAAGARDARRGGFAAAVQWAPWQFRSR